MGYGTGAFGSALGIYPLPPGSEQVADLSTSRQIDGETKDYVLDAVGGFVPMNDVDQRVLLTLSFADIETPFITPQDMLTQEIRIRNALAENGLLDPRAPAIQLLLVKVERIASGTTQKTVKFKNLITGTQRTLRNGAFVTG